MRLFLFAVVMGLVVYWFIYQLMLGWNLVQHASGAREF